MNEKIIRGGPMGSFIATLKGYFLEGPQLGPIIRMVECPVCGDPFLVKVLPRFNSRLLTTMFYYKVLYDTMDEHMHEAHNRHLKMACRDFVWESTMASLTRRYGRSDA